MNQKYKNKECETVYPKNVLIPHTSLEVFEI
jgi:hypothetical protein